MVGKMPGQFGLEPPIARGALAQFFQHAIERLGLRDDLGFAGAVRGQRERLGERGDGLVCFTLEGVSLSEGDKEVHELAVFQMQATSRGLQCFRIARERHSEAAQKCLSSLEIPC